MSIGELVVGAFELFGELGVALWEWPGRTKQKKGATYIFEFKRFAPEHVPLMYEWLRRPHVAEWWGDPPSLEEIAEEYVHRRKVDPYIVTIQGGRPIGFIQSYVAMKSGDGWWPNERDPGVVGIDQFFAEPEMLGKGMGTAMIRAFVERLFESPRVTRVQVDPSPKNHRAIRCYEKVGFESQGLIETPDGPAWYMTIHRLGVKR